RLAPQVRLRLGGLGLVGHCLPLCRWFTTGRCELERRVSLGRPRWRSSLGAGPALAALWGRRLPRVTARLGSLGRCRWLRRLLWRLLWWCLPPLWGRGALLLAPALSLRGVGRLTLLLPPATGLVATAGRLLT